MEQIKIHDLKEEINECNMKIVKLDNYLMQHSETFEYERLMKIQRHLLVAYVAVLQDRIEDYKENFTK